MPINYNSAPYFDDFDKNKNFMRVLFRPGRAVQARELTQAQTILQNQIKSISSSIFKENSRVVGAELSIKTTKETLVVNPIDSNMSAVDIAALNGFVIEKVGDSSTSARITHVDIPNNRVLLDVLGGTFTPGDSFVTINPNTQIANSVEMVIDSKHYSLMAHINNGIIYSGGMFLQVQEHQIVVDSSPSMATKEFAVGYIVAESTVNSIDDITLVDNAQGSYNYNAPGADRIHTSVNLSSYQVTRDANLAETSVTPDNLNKIMIIKNGIVVSDLIQNVKYADILDLLAHRTKAESGNYIVSQFTSVSKESATDPVNSVAVKIGRGSAFINGYEVINQYPVEIDIKRARTTQNVAGTQLYYVAGASFELSSFNKTFLVSEEETVTLYNDVAGAGTAIGTAKVLSCAINNFGELKLYLQGYESSISSFSSVRSIVGTTSGAIGVCKLDKTTNKPLYVIGGKSDGIVPIMGTGSLTNVATVPSNSIRYDVVRTFQNIVESSPNVFVINASNTTEDFLVLDGVYAMTDGATGNALIDPTDYTYTVNNTPGQISTLTINTVGAHSSINCIVPMFKSSTGARLKNLNKNVVELVTSDALGNITLGTYDILNFVLVEDMTVPANPVNVDPTTYKTNNGQTDWTYEFGSITGLTPNTDFRITVDHFAHTSSGDYFTVDSYMSLPANLDPVTGYTDLYSRVGNYTTNNMITYKLINCIDTRQTPANASTTDKFRAESQRLTFDFDYYVGRIDKISLDAKGNFSVNEGIPSASPSEPVQKNGAMDVAIVYVAPYTHTPIDCAVVMYNNRRYTMSDISKLDSRLRNVEDYVSLGLLEKTAASMNITDGNGLNRYKNGIFVDAWKDHNNGDTNNPDYNCTIDDINGGLVPNQQENFNALIGRPTEQINIHEQRNVVIPALSADTATLAYTEVEFISQKANSEVFNVNPYGSIVWKGQATLNPSSDIWVDTNYLPQINNSQGTSVAAVRRSSTNVSIADEYTLTYNPYNHINDPQVRASVDAQIANAYATGIPHQDTITQARDNIRAAFAGEKQTSGFVAFQFERDRTTTTTTSTTVTVPTTSTSSVDNITSTRLLPYMRARAVNYYLTGMRPNQVLQATFDTTDVSAYCSVLKADQYGNVSGTFNIPAGTFLVGTSTIKFFDAEASTDASADYYAKGTLETHQVTVTTIRSSYTYTTSTTASASQDSYATVYLDPIAQSFLVETEQNAGGVFVSSIDLYFLSKASDLPVSISLVTTIAGMPTQETIPLSEVSMMPSDVNISDNGFTKTTFKFEAPVFLTAGTEYAIVMVSNSNKYGVWTARQGDPILLDQPGQTLTNRGGLATSKQPYLGSFFKSQNSATWTPIQEVDMKFVINRCEFDVSTAGTYYFDTEDLVANGNEGIKVARFQPNIHSLEVSGTSIKYEYSLDNEATWKEYQNLDKLYVTSSKTLSTAAGNKPFTVRATLTSANSWVSPMLDLNRSGYATSLNLFDPVTFEGGTYISKQVQLADPALDMRVMIDLLEQPGAGVDVYFSTKTPQTPVSTTNVNASYDPTLAQSMVGKDVYVYHRDASTGNVTMVGGFVPTKIDLANNLTFASNISNVDIFVAPASSTTYANVDTVFYCMLPALTSAVQWTAVNHVTGTYVIHNNILWKALSATGTASPVVNSTIWEEVAGIQTTDALTTHTEVVWRPMVKEVQLDVTQFDPSANFYNYTMMPDSVIEEPFDRFAIKVVLHSTNDAVTPRARNLRAVAAT